MSSMLRSFGVALVLVSLAALLGVINIGPGPGPDPRPDPDPDPGPTPVVDSPFPNDGALWMIAAHESEEQSPAPVVANSKAIRDRFEENHRAVLDYDQRDKPSPWREALAWCEAKSGRKSYFHIRKGAKATGGLLSGDLDAMTAQILTAIEEVQ